jgi:hypothetical protein
VIKKSCVNSGALISDRFIYNKGLTFLVKIVICAKRQKKSNKNLTVTIRTYVYHSLSLLLPISHANIHKSISYCASAKREMSRHNYTNPAFCQDEATPINAPSITATAIVKNSPARVHRSESIRSFHSVASANRSLRSGMQRMNSGLSLNCSHHQQHQHQQQPLSLPPPRPGPKPLSSRIVDGGNGRAPFPNTGSRYGSISDMQNQSTTSGRYALVPVEELNSNNHGRYAILPPRTASRYLSKSQENLDRFDDENDGDELPHNYSDQFTSLPPISSPKKESNGMMPAFSTDFGSKSFILFDQKNHQRYAVVPTEENEEIVDENHEIIQMHNGKAHRYAVIPTDEEEETCLNGNLKPQPPAYCVAINRNRRTSPQRTPQKLVLQQAEDSTGPSTPRKNPLATQMLYELLSTPPQKSSSPFMRQNSTPLSPKNSPYRTRQQAHHASNPRLNRQDFTPQRLQYDQNALRMASTLNLEQRTTAIIQPRQLQPAASIYNETTIPTTPPSSANTEKSWNKNLKSHKQAIATIGFVSLLLMFCGVINSSLCIYMTSVSSISALYVSIKLPLNVNQLLIKCTIFFLFQTGRSYFLDIGIMSAFATVALSFLGFKYRHSDWLPNRHYISGEHFMNTRFENFINLFLITIAGFIMMTFFAITNCCALVLLLIIKPVKGTPLHDVTTGVSLALSLLILLLISLGVISSRLCRSPPPDNRIDAVF